jgi:prepilin-type N-terminal cleavage/methylation domain-containing protein
MKGRDIMKIARSDKGFTITEMLVAVALLGMIIAATASFYKYQAGHGKYTAKDKSFRDEVSMAMFMIRNDIMHAGYGIGEQDKLALFPNDSDGSAYRQLYVNYGRFLDSAITTSLLNVFQDTAYFDGADATSFLASNLDGKYTERDMDALIMGFTNASNEVTNVSVTSFLYDFVTSRFNPTGLSAGRLYVPAVSYKLENNALLRNGQVILGGSNYFHVTAFKIRALFLIGTTDLWAPENGAFANQQIANLRSIEVKTEYKFKHGATKKEGLQPCPGPYR